MKKQLDYVAWMRKHDFPKKMSFAGIQSFQAKDAYSASFAAQNSVSFAVFLSILTKMLVHTY